MTQTQVVPPEQYCFFPEDVDYDWVIRAQKLGLIVTHDKQHQIYTVSEMKLRIQEAEKINELRVKLSNAQGRRQRRALQRAFERYARSVTRRRRQARKL